MDLDEIGDHSADVSIKSEGLECCGGERCAGLFGGYH